MCIYIAKGGSVKKIIIAVSLVLWFLSGQVCAEIAIITPYSDENCDQFFDNKALLPNPGWDDRKNNNLITLLVNTIINNVTKKTAGYGFHPVNNNNLSDNNLFCFPTPNVIMANSTQYRQSQFSGAMEWLNLPLESQLVLTHHNMCCYVSYPFERPLITA